MKIDINGIDELLLIEKNIVSREKYCVISSENINDIKIHMENLLEHFNIISILKEIRKILKYEKINNLIKLDKDIERIIELSKIIYPEYTELLMNLKYEYCVV